MVYNDKKIIAAVLFVSSALWTLFAVRNLVIDLRFYSRNGWDLHADSGVKMGTGYGYQSEKLSAQQRLRYGHLLHVGVGVFLNVMSVVAFISFS